jgi:hypothetical protein
MTKRRIDRKNHPATFRTCKNLGQLIALVEQEGEKDKKFLTKISLNGKKMDQDEECLLENMSINEVDFIEVEMQSLNEIIAHSLTDIISTLQHIQMRAIQFAREIRKSNSIDKEKINFSLIECRTFIQSLEEVFIANQQGKFRIRHLPLWNEAEKELTNILQCILQSREVAAPDFIADLMEYDLIQALDQWEDTLDKELTENPALTGIFNLKSGRHKSDNEVDA